MVEETSKCLSLASLDPFIGVEQQETQSPESKSERKRNGKEGEKTNSRGCVTDLVQSVQGI